MRKRYLFLTILSLLVTMMLPISVYAQDEDPGKDPDKSEYDAAMEAIKDGSVCLLATEVDGIKFYVAPGGGLTSYQEDAAMFTFIKVDASGATDKLYDVAIKIEGAEGGHFSNTTLTDNKANLHPGTGVYRIDGSNNRDDWERQLFYLNAESGKFAIRSCNTAFATSSWKDAGRAFWTYEVDEAGEPALDETGTPVPCYSYAPAYIWEFEAPSIVIQISTILLGIANDYDTKTVHDPTGDILKIGTGMGQRADKDSFDKLVALVNEVLELLDKVQNELDPSDPDFPTVEQAEGMRTQADSLYQAILASEVPYSIPEDGYYRIIARMPYYTETQIKDEDGSVIDTERKYVYKAMLASFDLNYPDEAMYGTKKDLANYVWKLTQHGDSVLMQNVGMENYVSVASSDRLKLTKDESQISHVVFDYAAEDWVDFPDADGDLSDGDFKDIFYIRLANQPRHAGRYVHQLNHSRGKDSKTDQELCFWNDTYDYGAVYDTDGGTSEWYLEPVSEEEVAQLVKDFEVIVNHDVLVQKNQQLRDEVAAAIEDSKDIIREDLITSAAQLTSPNSDEAEGTNIGNLIDGDGGTFWHSSWHGSNQEPQMAYNEGSYHYLAISNMEAMIGNCELYFRQRNGADNDHPSEAVLFGANDPETDDAEWVEIAKLTIPNVGNGAENTIPFTVTEAYPYLRFIVTQVKKNTGADMEHRTYWHAAEIQIRTVKDNPTSRFVALGEIATNLVAILEENNAVADEDITPELYQKLLDAYELFKGGLIDPTELRNALAKYANVTKGVVEGTEPGQWAKIDVADAYNKLYAEAQAYNEGGKYTVEQIHKYAAMLKAMSKSVAEQANGVKTDTWYRIMFPTEEMYDAYGFDKSPADKTSLREDQAIMFGTFVSSAMEVTEEEAAPTEEDPDATANVTHLEAFEKADVSDVTRMFFMADEEITDKDLSMFRFIERPAEKADYTALFNEVMDNTAVALDLATTYTKGDALITDVAQLSSNASDEAEGKDLGALIDGNAGTFWHSDWHQKVLAPHYLQVALNEPVSGLIQIELTRRNNDFGHIVHMFIQGSNDAESWTNIGYFAVPYEAPSEVVNSPAIDLGGSYKYLRFINTRRAGLDIEMDPFAEITNKNQYQVDYTYFHSAEFQIYPVTVNGQSDATKALQKTYNDLHKIVNVYRDVTAENFATIKQAYNSYRTDYNASVGKAVLPNGADKAPASYAIQNKATGLFIKANDGNTADIFLKLTPTFFTYSAPGYERSLLHGVNLNGSTCNYLHGGESNRRFCTWTSSEAYSNSALVLREIEPVEPAEFTFNLSIKFGEIYDFCSTVPVTSKGEGSVYVGLGKYTNEDDVTFLALKKVETIEAGAPVFYIDGDTTQFDAEADADLVEFSMPAEPEFKLVGDTINGFMGCLVNHTLGANEIFFDDNYPGTTGKTGYYQPAPCVVVDTELCPEVDPKADYDFAICLEGEELETGVKDISSVVKKISQPGDVYSVDGKLLKTGATLNSLQGMGRGMYILNGVKVVVK